MLGYFLVDDVVEHVQELARGRHGERHGARHDEQRREPSCVYVKAVRACGRLQRIGIARQTSIAHAFGVITADSPYYFASPGIKPTSRTLTTQKRHDLERQREELLAALPRLRRFARSLTGNRQDGDDLMQTTVERALQRGWPEGVEALPWLFKVCKNLWIDELRARAVRVKAAQTRELDEEPAISGEAVALGEIGLREVEQALESLPPEQRACWLSSPSKGCRIAKRPTCSRRRSAPS